MPALDERFFRHAYGRLVAVLSRRVGVQYLQAVEDAVQAALMSALEIWPTAQLPNNPAAWLFRVADNHLSAELRTRSRRRRLLQANVQQGEGVCSDVVEPFLAGEVKDDLLRLLFICCDAAIPDESQLVLALKTLCGFDIREIATRLFLTDANVYKRLARARRCLRELPAFRFPNDAAELTDEQFSSRLPAVHQILYLLFTEGYLSSHAEVAIRRELCDEAIRLTTILADHPASRVPETCALLALMHLHVARLTGRQNSAGGLLLLEEQDREAWSQPAIQVGLAWLVESATGEHFSRFHAEAAIAAEHCLAPSLQATRWDRIVDCYALLEQIAPSSMHRLNRAVAVAESKGPSAGLAVLEGFGPPIWLAGSYLWAAVLADLHQRCGNPAAAEPYQIIALDSAPTQAVRDLLCRRFGRNR